AGPGWSEGTYAGLAALARVAVLDFKGAGDTERAHRALPQALIEDPGSGSWSESLARRLSFDAAVTSARALDALPARPAAVNLKPARMGGVLEALACATRCAAEGIAVYMGGMFEVGVGRTQLRALAALLCPDGPNDIAPLLETTRPARTAQRQPSRANTGSRWRGWDSHSPQTCSRTFSQPFQSGAPAGRKASRAPRNSATTDGGAANVMSASSVSSWCARICHSTEARVASGCGGAGGSPASRRSSAHSTSATRRRSVTSPARATQASAAATGRMVNARSHETVPPR